MLGRLLFFKSEYKKNIATLVTGTGVAQLIPIIAAPILTRIFTPEDFGLIALYLSIVSIATVLATGRYELAIMLPKGKEEVRAIVRLATIINFAVCSIVSLSVVFFNQEIARYLGNISISPWLYLLPFSIFMTAVYQLINYLLIREKNFKTLAINKVVVSSVNAGGQLGVGSILKGPLGLFVGNIVGQLISILMISKSTNIIQYFQKTKYPIKIAAYKYRKFPKYDIPAVLLNVMANQMPLLVLGKFFGLGVLGLYSFMYKILMMPINLLSNTILDVFKQKASEDYNNNGNCKQVFSKTFYQLLLLGCFPFLILGIYAPELFALVFGEDWKQAGNFAQILTPMLFLKFIVNPLSYTFYIVQKQNIDLIFQMLLFFLTASSLAIGVFFNSIEITLICFSVTSSLIYLIYLSLSYKYSLGDIKHVT